MKNKSGIYKIINIINNRLYIGSSVNIRRRWLEHKRLLSKGKHENNLLQNSWDKHGENCFVLINNPFTSHIHITFNSSVTVSHIKVLNL